MKTILIILAILMLAALPVSAQIPRLINYQGVLTDDMGVVVSDGSYSMTFRIYDVPSGGTHLWEETIDVNVSKGIFNTTLGHDVVITEVFDEPLYLALEINGGGELSPRRIFTANAHAFSSRAVYGVTNVFPAEGNVGVGTATPEAPLHIYTEITDPNTPALLIQNTGNHSLIDFKLATVTEARIRYSSSNDFFFGTLTSGGVSLRTNDLTRLRITGPGDVGIGTVGPLERLDVAGAIRIGTTGENNAGTLRWTGSDFEGYDGSLWHSLTSGGGSTLPSGTSSQTLYHDGMDWAATSNLFNNGSYVGIGTTMPTSPLHIVHTAGQVALQVDGDNTSWASIYINATGTGNPAYGYQRGNVTFGSHHIAADNSWHLRLDSDLAFQVLQSGAASFGSTPFYESLNIEGALMLGNTANNNSGAIRYTGTDFEGNIGSTWQSLTAGSLPAGTTNQTLRFDGADWVTSANLTNTGSAVGIGTAAPGTELHVYGATPWERIESNTATGFAGLELLSSGGEFESLLLQKYGPSRSGTVAGITIANLSRISTGTEAGALMLQTGGAEHIHFAIGGNENMRITNTGHIEGFYDGARYSQHYGTSNGGIFELFDDQGNVTASLQPDGSVGGGGYFYLRRNLGSAGFVVDGNNVNTQGTKVSVYGASSTIVLDASSTSDDSVVLPTSAIASSEMFDEPGVASSTSNTATLIATTATVLLSRTITVPASGYVLVIGTTQAQIGHNNGTGSTLNVGVSDVPDALPANQDVGWLIPTNSASATYTNPITVQGLFEVSAGANSFYLLGRSATASASMYGLDKQLSLVYIPTNYGTVLPTLASGEQADSDAPTDRGLSAGDISSERSASIAANDDRIERELAAMRERIATLESELGNK